MIQSLLLKGLKSFLGPKLKQKNYITVKVVEYNSDMFAYFVVSIVISLANNIAQVYEEYLKKSNHC